MERQRVEGSGQVDEHTMCLELVARNGDLPTPWTATSGFYFAKLFKYP